MQNENISRRDYFAAAALTGLLAGQALPRLRLQKQMSLNASREPIPALVDEAFQIADEMIYHVRFVDGIDDKYFADDKAADG